ncbi:uncharacterized protein LOC131302421 isoform X2 [Rhododendron vialii]|uniref:uncharacterized protein LOC131302421 isoform X2 n=1 Tax=Rhododendron vialii TaxID=182163 RepID=UPI00265DC963|nr:uncharacterized protein LOC131302421 isoform X2 [Rhododendron vialii]XP_058185045.1 uncharacterized protein LOC131302421 isoform X2 [Rhododendron vialii]XP_058185047.1 uncharacterized protein LOC131302421 isoform X2 [Rhododendron vialii]
MVEMFPLASADAAYSKISGMLSKLGDPFILPVIPILSQTVDTLTRLIKLQLLLPLNSRSHERTSASHANGIHHQQQLSNPPGTPPPIIPLVRSSNSPRGLATSQSDQSGGFFNFPPPSSSSQKPHVTENSLVNRIHPRERNLILIQLSHLTGTLFGVCFVMLMEALPPTGLVTFGAGTGLERHVYTFEGYLSAYLSWFLKINKLVPGNLFLYIWFVLAYGLRY